ncbi:hypothetical protein EUB48_04445 [Rhodoferax sediminis]|uniref:Uncharacterized protein n=1 Tax=Rhodoferax sediminis TaxID=2509614 RepID=A0A515D8A9_9BURK|nr:hypothetical protein EUB48_04445 [Rhodoferax sediminis]
MMSSDWKRRIRLFVERFWQPTSACMTSMPGSWGNLMSLAHWTLALQTGRLHRRLRTRDWRSRDDRERGRANCSYRRQPRIASTSD